MSKSVAIFIDSKSSAYSIERMAELVKNLVSGGLKVDYFAESSLGSEVDELPIESHLYADGSESRNTNFFSELIRPLRLVLEIIKLRPEILVSQLSSYSYLVMLAGLFTSSKRVLLYPASFVVEDKRKKSIFLRLAHSLNQQIAVFCATDLVVPTDEIGKVVDSKNLFSDDKIQNISLSAPVKNKGISFPFEDSKKWKKWLADRSEMRSALSRRLEVPEKSLIAVSCSPLTEAQSLEKVVRAISSVNKKVYLIVCADGPYRNQILSFIVGLGLTDQVVMLGEVEDRFSVIEAADLLILPKGTDGPADYIFDAILSGTAIISGENREMREMIKSDACFFDADDVGDIALQIGQIASKRNVLEGLMKTSVAMKSEFNPDWPKEVAQLVNAKKVK